MSIWDRFGGWDENGYLWWQWFLLKYGLSWRRVTFLVTAWSYLYLQCWKAAGTEKYIEWERNESNNIMIHSLLTCNKVSKENRTKKVLHRFKLHNSKLIWLRTFFYHSYIKLLLILEYMTNIFFNGFKILRVFTYALHTKNIVVSPKMFSREKENAVKPFCLQC